MPDSHATRSTLLRRLHEGDTSAAWRDFDEYYRDLILRYCRRQGLQHWDAEDVRQSVMLGLMTAFRNGFQYSQRIGKFRTYLGRVVINAIHAYRATPRPAPVIVTTEQLTELRSVVTREEDQAWEAEWRHHHIRVALKTIRPNVSARHFEVFERLLDGHSVREVAARHGMTEAAVRKVKQRIRRMLHTQIAMQVKDEDAA